MVGFLKDQAQAQDQDRALFFIFSRAHFQKIKVLTQPLFKKLKIKKSSKNFAHTFLDQVDFYFFKTLNIFSINLFKYFHARLQKDQAQTKPHPFIKIKKNPLQKHSPLPHPPYKTL